MFVATCYCSAVRLHFKADARGTVHCHCGECRALSGAAFTTWMSFAEHGMRLEGKEHLSAFDVTANVRRHFCRHCGTHVMSLDRRRMPTVGVPAGIVQGSASPCPDAHYFVDDRARWYAADDALPRFGGPSGFQRMP